MDEIYKLISAFAVAFFAYFLGLRTKKADIDNQKIKELNIVLSNMLLSWKYLYKLSELLQFSEDKSENFVFPKQYLPFVAFKTNAFDDNSFFELGKSIDILKQYDPFTHYELEGIDKKFDFLRLNYILPFLQTSQKENKAIEKLNRTFLDELLNDIEENMRNTSKLISKKARKKTDNLIQNYATRDYESRKEELNHEYYELMLSFAPEDQKNISYEEFLEISKTPEAKAQMEIEFEFIAKNGIDKLITLITENPHMSIEELSASL